jgi:hypothetical protein
MKDKNIKMATNNRWRFLLLLPLLTLLFAGCHITAEQISNTLTPNSIYTIRTEETPMSQITIVPPTKRFPTSTEKTILTSTQIKVPTLKPVITLSSTEATIRIRQLLTDNGKCQFPCWWGIIPGTTRWEKAYEILFPISREDQILGQKVYISNVEDIDTFSAGFTFLPGDEVIAEGYLIRKNVVNFIEIRFGNYRSYSLADLVSTYGTPEEVWIRTYSMEAQGGLPLDIILVYPCKGILAYYHSIDAFIADERVQKCYTDETVLVLDLWDPGEQKNFEQITTEAPMFSDMAAIDQFQMLGATTDLSIDSFAKLFTDPTQSHCINTPIQFWRNPFE